MMIIYTKNNMKGLVGGPLLVGGLGPGPPPGPPLKSGPGGCALATWDWERSNFRGGSGPWAATDGRVTSAWADVVGRGR